MAYLDNNDDSFTSFNLKYVEQMKTDFIEIEFETRCHQNFIRFLKSKDMASYTIFAVLVTLASLVNDSFALISVFADGANFFGILIALAILSFQAVTSILLSYGIVMIFLGGKTQIVSEKGFKSAALSMRYSYIAIFIFMVVYGISFLLSSFRGIFIVTLLILGLFEGFLYLLARIFLVGEKYLSSFYVKENQTKLITPNADPLTKYLIFYLVFLVISAIISLFDIPMLAVLNLNTASIGLSLIVSFLNVIFVIRSIKIINKF